MGALRRPSDQAPRLQTSRSSRLGVYCCRQPRVPDRKKSCCRHPPTHLTALFQATCHAISEEGACTPPVRAHSLTHHSLAPQRSGTLSPFRCLPLPLPCTFSVAHLRHALRSRCHHRPRASAACAPRVRLCFRHCTHIRRPDDQSVRQQWCAVVSAYSCTTLPLATHAGCVPLV